jgi:cytochrome c-type biogenesis protein CcmF
MVAGPALTYDRDAGRKLLKAVWPAVVVGIIAAAAAGVLGYARGPWLLLCTFIAVAVVLSVVGEYIKAVATRVRTSGENAVVAALHVLDLNHRRYGGQVVHIGVAVIVVGITASSLLTDKQNLQLTPGQAVDFAGGSLKLVELKEVRDVNFSAVEAKLTWTGADGKEFPLAPQRRFYDKSEQSNNEVAIHSTWRRDVYLVLAGWEDGGKVTAIQAIVNPLVGWIWAGSFVLVGGVVICLLPRVQRHAPQEAHETMRPVRGTKLAHAH